MSGPYPIDPHTSIISERATNEISLTHRPDRPFSPPPESHRIQAFASAFIDICDRLTCGVVMLDANGTVLFANAALAKFDKDGVQHEDGRLWASVPGEQRGLDGLIKGGPADGMTRDDPDCVQLSRPSGKAPLLIRVVRSRPHQSRRFEVPPVLATIFLVYGDGHSPTRHLRLAAQAGSDPGGSTSRLPHCRRSISKEAAETLGLTAASARFVLKVVYGKLVYAVRAS
jgi:hypothetical protein